MDWQRHPVLWCVHDEGDAEKRNGATKEIPAIGPYALDPPPRCQGEGDEDPAICGTDMSEGGLGRLQRWQHVLEKQNQPAHDA